MSDDYDWTPHLNDGEEVLWQGRPNVSLKLFLMRSDYFLWGFTVLGFPIFEYVSLVRFGGADRTPFMTAFQISFAVILLLARPWIDTKRRARLRYAVTRQRALRLDAKTNLILSQKPFTPGLEVESDRHETFRIDPTSTDDARAPMDWRIYPHVKRRGVFSYLGTNIAPINGYDEHGLEFRMLDDPERVNTLVQSQIAKAAP